MSFSLLFYDAIKYLKYSVIKTSLNIVPLRPRIL